MKGVRPGARMSVALPVVALLAGAGALTAVTLLVVHAADSSSDGLRAAPKGDTPECRRVARAYPDGLAGLDRADTGPPGAAAWGDGAVTARCGLAPPAPTTDACVAVDGVDWVWRPPSRNDAKVLVTYGRDPAVEITISGRVTAVDDVLVKLSGSVKSVAQRARCIGEDDV